MFVLKIGFTSFSCYSFSNVKIHYKKSKNRFPFSENFINIPVHHDGEKRELKDQKSSNHLFTCKQKYRFISFHLEEL